MRFLSAVCFFIYVLATPTYANATVWKDVERQSAVQRLLQSKPRSFECGSACEHRVFDVKSVSLANHNIKLIAAASSAPDNGCHACSPQLSYFFYRVDDKGWKLTSKHVAYHFFGSWGGYNDEGLSLVKLSDDSAMVILEFGYTGQGYTEESITGLMPKGEKLKKVLSTCSGSSNEGAVTDPDTQEVISWSAKLNASKSYSAQDDNQLHFEIKDTAANKTSNVVFGISGTKYAYLSGDVRMKGCGYD